MKVNNLVERKQTRLNHRNAKRLAQLAITTGNMELGVNNQFNPLNQKNNLSSQGTQSFAKQRKPNVAPEAESKRKNLRDATRHENSDEEMDSVELDKIAEQELMQVDLMYKNNPDSEEEDNIYTRNAFKNNDGGTTQFQALRSPFIANAAGSTDKGSGSGSGSLQE